MIRLAAGVLPDTGHWPGKTPELATKKRAKSAQEKPKYGIPP
jgi:hypothetical protein